MAHDQLIIFDLDDTLIDTSHVYWTSRQCFIEVLAKQGLNSDDMLELFESFDEKHMKTLGFVPERYLFTMLEVYAYLVETGHLKKDPSLDKDIHRCGGIVLNQLPELIDGAKKLLDWSSQKFKLILMTRGVEFLQTKKIAYVGIAEYFDEILIVSKKEASDFAKVISTAGYTPETTWIIGDSIRSDINPALAANVNCILYLYTHHSYYWRQEYGVTPIRSFFKVDNLEEAIHILANPDSKNMMTPLEWSASLLNSKE